MNTRRSKTKIVILASSVLMMLAAPVCGTEEGWLGEMVPWPMMSTGIAMVELELSSEPIEGERGPELCSDEAQYGLIALGDGSDPGVSCAVSRQPGEPPVLVVDVETNETLADDRWMPPTRRLDLDGYGWLLDVMVEFSNGDTICRIPYHLLITAAYSHEVGDYVWFYGGSCHRRGVALFDGVPYLVGMTNLRTSGGYEDPETLVVAMDVDRDGILNTLPGAHEVFGPGQDVVLDSGRYRIASTRADGTWIEFERVGEAPLRPAIEVGLPAPGFEIVSVTGHEIQMPDAQQTSVLVFACSGASAGCSTCVPDLFLLPERVRELERVLTDLGCGAVRIVVITDREVSAEVVPAPLSNIPVKVCVAPDVVDLYRRTDSLLVVGPDGTIAAMDEFWSTFIEGQPVVRLHRLSALDVTSIISRLAD